MQETTPSALEGIRVLDATQMLAGPLAATRLGDLGADVIKIEPPKDGEFNRTHGFGDVRHAGEMTTFLAVNRNKRSLAVDLKSEAGRDAVRRLAASSDVFIQNFRHGTAERLGIGYEDLAPLNPGIIYCSISGFGRVGPYRSRPGQDLILQGYSGSMFSVGAEGDAPSPGALWAADVMTGYQAAIGILAALHERMHSGRGQHVEVDMFSVVLDSQLQELVTYLNTGKAPTRSASPAAHASIPGPYGVYRTADGWLTLAMSPLVSLGEMLDSDWLRSLTSYNDGMLRRDEIYAHIENAFLGRTTAEWVELADQHGVWAGPVHDYASLAADPHLKETGAFVQQPQGGVPTTTLRPPLHLSRTPAAIRRGAPALGEHSAEILTSIGYSPDEVAGMAEAGVIRAVTPEEMSS